MFADDLLLFGKATERQMQTMKSTLDRFCTISGQKVSLEKTNVLFSRNVPSQVRSAILNASGIREIKSLGRYLGVPLLGHAPKKQDFTHLVEKVQDKLSGWKATQLSFAGRVTLSRAVIQAVPVYSMMTTPIPKSCLDDIQRLQHNFIWGD